jgi:hypothetical protein
VDGAGGAGEEGVGCVDPAVIRYHARRCMLTSARCAGPFISIRAAILMSNCRTVTCPLAQSVERIHGKENLGAILLLR